MQQARLAKGLSQEALAELSGLTTRTIQRIESSANQPRGSSFVAISQVLNLDQSLWEKRAANGSTIGWFDLVIKIVVLLLVNLAIMSVLGYLTLDSSANTNSRLGAGLIAILLPLVLIALSPTLQARQRVVYFGSGLVVYIILALFKIGFVATFTSSLLPVCCLMLVVLYYGHVILALGNSSSN